MVIRYGIIVAPVFTLVYKLLYNIYMCIYIYKFEFQIFAYFSVFEELNPVSVNINISYNVQLKHLHVLELTILTTFFTADNTNYI